MNQIELTQFVLGSIGDMLNGDHEEPDPKDNSLKIPWINRNGKRVNTVINLDPNLAEYLTKLHKEDHDQYGHVFDEIEDFVALKAFVQRKDET